ncbi:MAG: NigD-like C-terminal domain-containing protein [Rikenellaceae bacterium]
MKKFKFTALLFFATTLTLFTSCIKETETEDYLQAFGTIETVSGSTSMVFQDDMGKTIYVTESSVTIDQEYEGMRGCLSYVPIEDTTVSSDDVLNAKLIFLEIVETKEAEGYYGQSDEELFTEYGSPKITVTAAWLGGTYLNILYYLGYDSLTSKRTISLLIDESRIGSMTAYGQLYYKADGVNTDYFFSNYGVGLVSFDLKKFVSVSSLAAFNIEFCDAKTGEQDDYSAKYAGIEVNPVSSTMSY